MQKFDRILQTLHLYELKTKLLFFYKTNSIDSVSFGKFMLVFK